MSRHSSDVVRDAERVVRRASWWSVWMPILAAALAGFAAALAVAVVVALSWRPDGMGM